jgi:hypothetical protein
MPSIVHNYIPSELTPLSLRTVVANTVQSLQTLANI